jgi:transcriptional regulator with XRE-family HTH domain
MVDHRSRGNINETLAANLRRLRIARRLSLSELARTTGISKATLSGIEHGGANPTVETLARLTDALRITLSELLEEAPPGEIQILRASQGVPTTRDGLPRVVLQDAPGNTGIEVAKLALDAGQAYEASVRPAGARAHLFVHSGRMIAGPVDRYTELAIGDYAAFPADVPQLYEAARQPARALLVVQFVA